MRSLLLPAVTLAALLLVPCAAALAGDGQVVDDEVKRKKEAISPWFKTTTLLREMLSNAA